MILEQFLTKAPSEQELIAAMHAIFGVSASEMIVVNDMEPRAIKYRLICEVTVCTGDFQCYLSIYADEDLNQRSERKYIRQLCVQLNCDACFGDSTPNPWSCLLMKPDGSIKHVFLNDDVDKTHAYITSQSDSFPDNAS
jgi:hypothetical protein